MTKIEKDRIGLKAAIVEQNLDMLDYEQMRGIYLATLQIAKDKQRGHVPVSYTHLRAHET